MTTNTDKYVPKDDDERIAHAYAEMIHLRSEGMVSHDEAVEEFYAYLAARDARAHRDAAREALSELADEAIHVNWYLDGPSFALRVRRFKNRKYPRETR